MPESERICVRCVMDTSDPEITFNSDGICSHCVKAELERHRYLVEGAEGEARWETLMRRLRQAGRGKSYDCIIGLSGGVDSSFLARELVRRGARPLALHVDGGWNSEIAVRNIEVLVKGLGLELETFVVDWEEMRDLQLAYLKSGVANQDTPQDHAFFAVLHRFRVRHRIRYVISGHNFATESILPGAWGYDPMDSIQLRDIHRRFGTRPLRRYPILNFWTHKVIDGVILGRKMVTPLNWQRYDKAQAQGILESEMDWRPYGGKHSESRFTKFFQTWYLPRRFGWDKRRAHLSSLIVSGQMDREAALRQLSQPPVPPAEAEEDQRFVAKKLGISEQELEDFIRTPPVPHSAYKSGDRWRLLYRRWKKGTR